MFINLNTAEICKVESASPISLWLNPFSKDNHFKEFDISIFLNILFDLIKKKNIYFYIFLEK